MKQIPSSLSDYIGQEKHKKNLLLQIEAARMRKDSVSHFLMSGPDSMGKSTLASIAAQMLGVHTRTVDCGERLKFGDVAAILTHLRMGDFLFLENVELLKEDVVGLL